MVGTGYSLARLALLGIWAGAMLAFGGLFVPAAFSNLPTQLAASVLGDGFAALDRGGVLFGAACVALGWLDARTHRAPTFSSRVRVLLPLVGLFAHLASGFAVTPEIRALREASGTGIGQLPEAEMAEFARLHSASRSLFALATASAALACVWDVIALRSRAVARVSRDTEERDF